LPSEKKKRLMWSSTWARGVPIEMEKWMKLRGKNSGQEVPTQVEERISSGAAHSC